MRNLKITQKADGQPDNNQTAVKKKKPKTLLEHIECITELVEGSKLSEEFFKKAEKNIRFVAKKMDLTSNQVALLSVFVEKSDNGRICLFELSSFIGCKHVKVLCLLNDIDELVRRRFIRGCRYSDTPSFRVPPKVVQALSENRIYVPDSTQNISVKELFNHVYCLFDEREDSDISYAVLIEELRALLKDSPSLVFCRQMEYLEEEGLNTNEWLFLFYCCHQYVNHARDCVDIDNAENLYDGVWEHRVLRSALQNGKSNLLQNDLLEYKNDKGFGDRDNFCLTKTAQEKLFADIDVKIQQAENKIGLILHPSITSKELFYNAHERSQIQQLSQLLNAENFLSVQQRLEESGLRKGFACLFYGAPGTGKTETVYQIAKATGRDIMMVNISEAKSMWFGESEKRVKGIFDSYRAHVQSSKVAPILLFNEADAIIGKRKENAHGAVHQTENTIQNILLQEMESLDGIMIATTNLSQNLDRAFERRFLYKIEFSKPEVEAKAKIWQVMLPALRPKEALDLARHYDFSGGQIENIVRKYTVESILNGTTPSLTAIHGYCQSESLYKTEVRNSMGFATYGKGQKLKTQTLPLAS
jgi:ATPases of the AAA+ class